MLYKTAEHKAKQMNKKLQWSLGNPNFFIIQIYFNYIRRHFREN